MNGRGVLGGRSGLRLRRWLPLWQMRRFLRPYAARLVRLGALAVASTAMLMLTPLVYRHIVNDGILDRRAGVVVALAAVLLLLSAAGTAGEWAESRLTATLGEDVAAALRAELFRGLQGASLDVYVERSGGELAAHFSTEVVAVQQALTMTLMSLVRNGLTALGALVAVWLISWPIAVGVLLTVPVLVVASLRISAWTQRAASERMTALAAMAGRLWERLSLSGALFSRLHSDPAAEIRRFGDDVGAVRMAGVEMASSNAAHGAVLDAMSAAAILGVYGIGGTLAARGTLDPGAVVALAAYVATLYGPLTALSAGSGALASAAAAAARVEELISLPPADRDCGAAVLPTGPVHVAFRGVRFSYGGATGRDGAGAPPGPAPVDRSEALRGVTFEATPGTVTAVVGPSGAGKSTIALLLAKMRRADAGCVTLNGLDIGDVAASSLRRRVAVVTQEAYLLHASVRENLLRADPDAQDDDLIRALTRAQAWKLVSRLPAGLDTVLGDRGQRLSAGERQRVALARLFLRRPEVVVLDEATANLDVETERLVHQELRALAAQHTVISIMHRLHLVHPDDHVVVVEEGVVVEHGREAVLARRNGPYRRLRRRLESPWDVVEQAS